MPLTGIVQLLRKQRGEEGGFHRRIDAYKREKERQSPGFRGLIAYGVYAEIRFEWHNTKITRRT